MLGFSWKGALLVAAGTALVLWTTGGLLAWPEDLAFIIGVILMTSGTLPQRSRERREHAEVLRRLDALEGRPQGVSLPSA